MAFLNCFSGVVRKRCQLPLLYEHHQTKAESWAVTTQRFGAGPGIEIGTSAYMYLLLCVCMNYSVFQLNARSLLVGLTDHYFLRLR